MISQAVIEVLQKYVSEDHILYNEPLKNHTTFRVGGEADCVVKITDTTALSKILNYLSKVEIPYYVMGNGSNLLVSDEGYRGIVLSVAEGLSEISVVGNRIYADAGAYLSKVARVAAEHGLTGLEFAAGIPGTVGGGIVMNAGAYDGEMKQVVESVTVLDAQGNELELDNETMEFGYRTSVLKRHPFVATRCCFVLEQGDKQAILDKMSDFQTRRKEKQPLEYPSAGSTFKRPEGHFAGKLIMDAGLAGYSIGGAQVSAKHCGFIINTGDATASDVHKLITFVQEEVYDRFFVRLEPEVIMLGKF